MSRTAPLEVCARCEMLKPSTEMTNVYARAANGRVICLRICRTCACPVLTYIAGRWPTIPSINSGRLLLAGLAMVLVVLNVIFGIIIAGPHGFAVALSGILVGAGILAAVAASHTMWLDGPKS